MIYIVSGYMRSGTSMMMRALAAGGLTPAFDSARDEIAIQRSDADYKANPHGLFEIPFEDYNLPDFEHKYSGRLVKVFSWGLPFLPRFERRIVFMRREPEEIRQSLRAMFYENKRKPMIEDVTAPADAVQLWYRDVIHEPVWAFRHLQSKGWPVDPVKCAATVDPSLYRFRLERLVAGA